MNVFRTLYSRAKEYLTFYETYKKVRLFFKKGGHYEERNIQN
jgi:hypothetical protein